MEADNSTASGLNYINVYYRGKRKKLLIDTGATVSVLFEECLDKNYTDINKTRRISLRGVTGKTVCTRGTLLCDLEILDNSEKITLTQEFAVMKSFTNKVDGVIGSDFLYQYFATIDYESLKLSLHVEGMRRDLEMLSMGEIYTIIIPRRCEKLFFFEIGTHYGDFVTIPQEIAEGIFSAGTVSKPVDGKIPIRILNINDREIIVKNFRPKVERLDKFDVFHMGESKQSVSRAERLLNIINTKNLSLEEKRAIEKICVKYSDVFFLENDPCTTTDVYKAKIKLQKGVSPAYTKPYRLPHGQKTEINRQVDKMLKDGIIENAISEFSSPLLIVPKKNDENGNKKWRVVIDYRQLNNKIENDRFPLPCIEEILDALSGATYFSHLDLYQGYYQIELDSKSRPYTAFATDRGQYQMTRLPMGLKTSPGCFSRAMTMAMSGLNYENMFIYLDDLIVFGNSLQQHNQNLVKVLERLRKVNLKLNPIKCEFMKKELLYLGHKISNKGVAPDPEKITALEQYPIPQNAKEAKRFVAFANYYRKHINHFAEIAAPLNRLSRKNVKFEWTTECQKAFESLKTSLSNPPVMEFPDLSEENTFILRTDASGIALGATLSNGNDKPVAYASRTLNKAEMNYPTIEKELLAIVWSIAKWRHYLLQKEFIILTDHRPLVYLFGMTNPSSRLTKFRLKLEEYDFTIKYVKGAENVTADALSRIEVTSEELKQLNKDSEKSILVMTRAQTKKQEEITDSKNEWTDQPDVVELLKFPKSAVEVKLIDKDDCKTMKLDSAEENTNSSILYNEEDDIIYLIRDFRSTSALRASLRNSTYQEPRSTSALRASLRALIQMCAQKNIKELVLVKNNKNQPIIEEIRKDPKIFKERDIKICIVQDKQNIADEKLRRIIINDFHMLPTGGHAGINRMYKNIRKYYFWNSLRKDIEEFVKRCDDCQRHKHSIITKQPLTITSTATCAFDTIFIDLVGPFEMDDSGNRYILTLQCELSKYIEGYVIKNKEAETVAKALVENFILRYGVPRKIVTDQGSEFMARTFKETCSLLQIEKLNSTAYHHETIGALENTHKHLNAYLRIQLSKFPTNWSTWVQYFCFSYNISVHSATGYTPFELVFGKICRLPTNVQNEIEPLYNFDDYPMELKYRLQVAAKEARETLTHTKHSRKKNI